MKQAAQEAADFALSCINIYSTWVILENLPPISLDLRETLSTVQEIDSKKFLRWDLAENTQWNNLVV